MKKAIAYLLLSCMIWNLKYMKSQLYNLIREFALEYWIMLWCISPLESMLLCFFWRYPSTERHKLILLLEVSFEEDCFSQQSSFHTHKLIEGLQKKIQFMIMCIKITLQDNLSSERILPSILAFIFGNLRSCVLELKN